MKPSAALGILALLTLSCGVSADAPWPEAKAPAIASASGFVVIPGAVHAPGRTRVYHAVFDATRGADAPDHLLPALDNAGSELNAIAASGFPLSNAQFAIVFHGDAVDGILSDAHYQEKFGVANPNLPVLEQMEKAGVELVVCGQFLAAQHIDPHTLSPRVKVASDALLALMDFQEKGYALLSF